MPILECQISPQRDVKPKFVICRDAHKWNVSLLEISLLFNVWKCCKSCKIEDSRFTFMFSKECTEIGTRLFKSNIKCQFQRKILQIESFKYLLIEAWWNIHSFSSPPSNFIFECSTKTFLEHRMLTPSVRFTWLTEWQNECYIWRGASHVICSSTLLILSHPTYGFQPDYYALVSTSLL